MFIFAPGTISTPRAKKFAGRDAPALRDRRRGPTGLRNFKGEMPEWSIGAVSKTVVPHRGTGGSNPPLSAKL
jgi:hypothetical protein